jgi:hypothetical protein
MACKWYKICPLRSLEEKDLITDKWKKEYCKTKSNWENCVRFQTEEKGEIHPDNLMPDGTIIQQIR